MGGVASEPSVRQKAVAEANGPVGAAVGARGFRLGHLRPLDGLRGLAILLVLLCHSKVGQYLVGANSGVDLFFVLSGFLITSILLREWDQTGRISLRKFYARRALRLLPVVCAFLVVCLAYSEFTHLVRTDVVPVTGEDGRPRARSSCGIFPEAEAEVAWQDALSVLLYYYNWKMVLVGQKGGLFHHMWSLSVEEQFYLVWPVLLVAALAFRVPRRLIVALTVVLLGSVVCYRLNLAHDGVPWSDLYFRSDTRVDGMLCGALTAFLIYWGYLPRGRWFHRVLAAAVPIAVFLLGWQVVNTPVDERVTTLWGAAVNGSTAVLIVAVVHSKQRLLSWVLGFFPLVWLGQISYGLYVWHRLVILVVRHYFNIFDPTTYFMIPFVYLGLAWVSYRYLETPFLRLKDRFKPTESDAPLPTPALAPALRRAA